MSLLADKHNNNFKSQLSASNIILVFRDICQKVAGTYLGFILLGVGFYTIYNIYSADTANAAGSITVTINDSSADLNLVAAEGGVAYGESDTASFSVSTTSTGGYTTTITGGNSDGKLTGTDSSNYFTSINSAIASPANFNNGTWGFKPNAYNGTANVIYQPVPTSSEAALIDRTSSAMTGNYTLAVAAKTDTNTAADTYSYKFTVAATTNATDYDIAFVDPGSNMPERMINSTTGSTVTLPSTTPVRDGYTFAGWCTESVSPGSACTGTTYTAGATYTLTSGSANDVTLYALWEQSAEAMQDFWCSELTTGQTTTLVDARDNIEYNVAKLADGKCWMLDNLAFNGKDNQGSGSYVTMNDSNTNISGSATWNDTIRTGWTSGTQNSYTASYINDASKSVVSSNAKDQAGQWKVGVYYNYCAATVGTICTDGTTTEATQDVCPKGWRLPTGGGSGEFQTLYNNGSYNTYDKYRDALHLPLSGWFYDGQPDSQASSGRWWSSTAYHGTARYNLYVATSGINPANGLNRRYGLSIRCVAK